MASGLQDDQLLLIFPACSFIAAVVSGSCTWARSVKLKLCKALGTDFGKACTAEAFTAKQ
jgi:hypothetical protein